MFDNNKYLFIVLVYFIKYIYSYAFLLVCDNIIKKPLKFQLKFLKKLNDELNIQSNNQNSSFFFFKRKNTLFLSIFFPLFMKDYRYEDIFPQFLCSIVNCCPSNTPCYYFLKELRNDFMKKIEKVLKEDVKIKEETIAMFIFVSYFNKPCDCEQCEIGCLNKLFIKILEYLGKVEEEEGIKRKEKENKEKDLFFILKEFRLNENTRYILNRKEFLILNLIRIIFDSNMFNYFVDSTETQKDERIGDALLKIVKDHLRIKRNLIQKGNISRIIPCLELFCEENEETFLFVGSFYHSLPFTDKTLKNILRYYNDLFMEYKNEEVKKEFLKFVREINNHSADITELLEKCITYLLFKKRVINWKIIDEILRNLILLTDWKNNFDDFPIILSSFNSSTFIYDFYLTVEKMINILFNYEYTNNINDDNEEENERFRENWKLYEHFLMNEDENTFNSYLHRYFICHHYYSVLDFCNFAEKPEEGNERIGKYLVALSGEDIRRTEEIKRWNSKERNRYERERKDESFLKIINLLYDFLSFSFEVGNKDRLESKRNKDVYKKRKKKIKEAQDNFSDFTEEEDMEGCLTLFLEHSSDVTGEINNEDESDTLTTKHCTYSNNALICLFCPFIKRICHDNNNHCVESSFEDLFP